MKILSHNYTGKSIALVFVDDQGKVQNKIVESSHLNWAMIMAEYKKGDYLKIIPLLEVQTIMAHKSKGKMTIEGDKVLYDGKPTSGYLYEKMIFFFKELPKQFDRLVKFADNIHQNPNEQAQADLYRFLDRGSMPLTDDGCFLAYKGVDQDYWSWTSGRTIPLKGKTKPNRVETSNTHIFNGIGEEIEVDRKDVSSDPNRDCHHGLHAGSFKYANDFKKNGHLMIIKINPRDVCSVPYSDSQKLRCCRYEVIAEAGAKDGGKLDEKRDSNFDQAAKVRYHNKRDAKGHFIKV